MAVPGDFPYSPRRTPRDHRAGTGPYHPTERDFLVAMLVETGWNADHRAGSQSAQYIADQILDRRPNISSDELTMIPELIQIVLRHNTDPTDTDLIGTAIELAEYIWETM